jgi:glycine hydroxymethyltransferase
MKEDQMKEIAGYIAEVVNNLDNDSVLHGINSDVGQLCSGFPVYK